MEKFLCKQQFGVVVLLVSKNTSVPNTEPVDKVCILTLSRGPKQKYVFRTVND